MADASNSAVGSSSENTLARNKLEQRTKYEDVTADASNHAVGSSSESTLARSGLELRTRHEDVAADTSNSQPPLPESSLLFRHVNRDTNHVSLSHSSGEYASDLRPAVNCNHTQHAHPRSTAPLRELPGSIASSTTKRVILDQAVQKNQTGNVGPSVIEDPSTTSLYQIFNMDAVAFKRQSVHVAPRVIDVASTSSSYQRMNTDPAVLKRQSVNVGPSLVEVSDTSSVHQSVSMDHIMRKKQISNIGTGVIEDPATTAIHIRANMDQVSLKHQSVNVMLHTMEDSNGYVSNSKHMQSEARSKNVPRLFRLNNEQYIETALPGISRHINQPKDLTVDKGYMFQSQDEYVDHGTCTQRTTCSEMNGNMKPIVSKTGSWAYIGDEKNDGACVPGQLVASNVCNKRGVENPGTYAPQDGGDETWATRQSSDVVQENRKNFVPRDRRSYFGM